MKLLYLSGESGEADGPGNVELLLGKLVNGVIAAGIGSQAVLAGQRPLRGHCTTEQGQGRHQDAQNGHL